MKCNLCDKQFDKINNYNQHVKKCNLLHEIKENVIKLYLEENFSMFEIQKKFFIRWYDVKLMLGDLIRNRSDARKNAQTKYKFKHTDESKEKIRKARLKYMVEHPENTAWRKSNLSYPEKLFLNKINELNWDNKYCIIREYSIFPYFIDFAFINEKIAFEIDGSQHLLPERKESDNKKDFLLENNGWSIIRVTENEIKTNINNVILILENKLINNSKFNKINLGIFLKKNSKNKIHSDLKSKLIRDSNGRTEKEKLSAFNQRKVKNRPEYEILIKEIHDYGYKGVGKKYNVSDNTIRKWKKYYEKTNGVLVQK